MKRHGNKDLEMYLSVSRREIEQTSYFQELNGKTEYFGITTRYDPNLCFSLTGSRINQNYAVAAWY